MRDSLKSRVAWSSLGWLAPLAFLALPDCTFNPSIVSGGNFDYGDAPHSSAIFCEIEDRAVDRRCATDVDLAVGIPLTQAAMALTKKQTSGIGLDYSPTARAALGCSDGPPVRPVAVTFKCPFPEGCPVCLNCGGVIGSVYADVNAACVVECEDLNGNTVGEVPPAPEVIAYCEAHARASTNASGCFDGACTDAGALRTDFDDPRRVPEPVIWTNAVGVGVSGPDSNTLTRTAPTSVSFDAGAASSQTITGGDGYVEFTATETDQARACGLASGGGPDNDVTLADISFGIRLGVAGNVNISESGTAVPGPDINGGFGTYATGDRLRVSVADNFDGTADIKYFLIPAVCAGAGCDGMLLRTVGGANYPFRVDASIRTQGGTLTDVRIVRIK